MHEFIIWAKKKSAKVLTFLFHPVHFSYDHWWCCCANFYKNLFYSLKLFYKKKLRFRIFITSE